MSILTFSHWLKQPKAPPGNCELPLNEVGGTQLAKLVMPSAENPTKPQRIARFIMAGDVNAFWPVWARSLSPKEPKRFGRWIGMRDCLLVVLADSLADGGRKAAIAFGVALAALSNGTTVHVFLSLESARLGTPTGSDGIMPRGFSEPLSEYIRHFADLGGQLEVCSSCFEEYCQNLPKDERGRPQLRPGTSIHSLGIVAERAGSMPIVTF